MDELWLWADRASIVFGILLAVPVFWTWWQIVFGGRRQRRRWLQDVTRQPGERPGVLIVDPLSGKNIETGERAHPAADPRLKAVSDDRIALVRGDQPLRPADADDLARDLRAASRRLLDAGCDVIRLFHGGPDVSALIVGAELANGPHVLLYHYGQGRYQAYGPLEPLRGIA